MWSINSMIDHGTGKQTWKRGPIDDPESWEMVSIWLYVSANVILNSCIYTTFTILCIFEGNVCLIVRFPSSEERKCSTFHKGTQSLQEKTLKPGGHSSACSVNRSSSFFTKTCCWTHTLPLPVPCSSNPALVLFQHEKNVKKIEQVDKKKQVSKSSRHIVG